MNICKINTFKRFKGFGEYNGPIFFASLVSTVQICSSQDMFSSNITPKNFIAVFLSILLSAIFKAGNFRGRSSLEDFFLKKSVFSFLVI